MRITKKSLLVELLSGVQVVCLTVALLGGAFWVRTCVQDIVRTQIIQDNQLIAQQMSNLIGHRNDITDVKYGNASWEVLQSLIEDVSLPNSGYMCVADKSGQLLCHPKIRSNPELRQSNLLEHQISVDDQKKATIRSLLDRSGTGSLTGTIGSGRAAEVVSVASLSDLNSSLFVHQSEKGFRRAVNMLLIPIGGIALVVGLGLILVTKRASVGILNRYENKIAEINEGLEETVRTRSRALTKTRDAVILGLAKLSESRDNDTGQHLERIGAYVNILTKHLASLKPLPPELLEDIGLASSLHDIGKVGVPDQVLLKPGRLDAEERKAIEVHPKIGQSCLEIVGQRLGEDNFLSLATEICAYHHEKWDGSGYPYGLAGTDIPVSARIVAVADVYDALRSRRPYKEPMSHAKAREIILSGAGTHFDPDLIQAFSRGDREFEEYSDLQLDPSDSDSATRVHAENEFAEPELQTC